MNCSSSEALFERYLEGDLPPVKAARLVAHLDRCRNCREVLEELRVVDALLLTPRQIELAPNFTFATMAEVRAMPVPRRRRSPVAAYLVSYVVAAWILVGAMVLLEPAATHAWLGVMTDLARAVADLFGGVGTALARIGGRSVPVRAVVAGAVALDVTLALLLGIGVAVVRPRLAERLRT